MEYSYPDKNDAVTIELVIKNTEPYPGYWEKSEMNALSFFEKIVTSKISGGSLLDLASGEGRLTKKFAPYFKSVTALEPDEERMNRAQQKCAEAHLENVNFIQTPFLESEMPANSFDVVLCSHLIQHIHTNLLEPTFKKIHTILKPGGYLVLTTNCTKSSADKFEKQSRTIENIDEEIFNTLTRNDRGILPVHYFALTNLKHLLSELTIEKTWMFHDESKRFWPDSIVFRDTILNLFQIPFGRDIFILARKKEENL